MKYAHCGAIWPLRDCGMETIDVAFWEIKMRILKGSQEHAGHFLIRSSITSQLQHALCGLSRAFASRVISSRKGRAKSRANNLLSRLPSP